VSSGPNGERPYELSYSEVVQKAFEDCQRRASSEGRGREFLEATAAVFQRLQFDPTAFGEPLYRLVHMRLQVRTAAVGPLSVVFAVSDDRPVVYLKAVELLSGG